MAQRCAEIGDFMRMFAERLNKLSAMHVKEAEDGEDVRCGHVLLAPGGRQMRLVPARQGWKVRVEPGGKSAATAPRLTS